MIRGAGGVGAGWKTGARPIGLGFAITCGADDPAGGAPLEELKFKLALVCESIALDREIEYAMTERTSSAARHPMPEKITIRELKEEAAKACLRRVSGVREASLLSGC